MERTTAKEWRLKGKAVQGSGKGRTTVDLDFKITDDTMKKLLKLLVAERQPTERGRGVARSKTRDLRDLF